MAKTLSRWAPIRLSFKDGEVIVTPQDQDIFFISAQKAVEACSEHIRDEERVARFRKEFLTPLNDWCRQHADRIAACYVAMPESAVLPVYAIGAKEAYDFDLTEILSSLAFWFEDNGWSVHASQIPKCDPEQLLAFFNAEHAIQVYG